MGHLDIVRIPAGVLVVLLATAMAEAQSAPVVDLATPPNCGALHRGDVTVNYTLSDDQSDPCDLTVEYSTDLGATQGGDTPVVASLSRRGFSGVGEGEGCRWGRGCATIGGCELLRSCWC
jgi:hypothetical protein